MSLNHLSQYSQLTDAHFKAIGKVVVEWSNIELLLRIVLTKLLLTPDFPGRTFTDRLTAAKVQEAIEEATSLHLGRYRLQLVSDQDLRKISDANKRVTALRGTRNKFAHFCWSRNTDEELFGINFSGGLSDSKNRKSYIVLKLSEINDFHSECYDMVERLTKILENFPEMKEDGIKKKLTWRGSSA